MARALTSKITIKRSKVSRPGVHSKNNTSRHKGSVNYKKKYKGQGR